MSATAKSPLFEWIEHVQGARPWGAFLDAGTGVHSVRWVTQLQTERWTAVTGAIGDAERVREATKGQCRPQDKIIHDCGCRGAGSAFIRGGRCKLEFVEDFPIVRRYPSAAIGFLTLISIDVVDVGEFFNMVMGSLAKKSEEPDTLTQLAGMLGGGRAQSGGLGGVLGGLLGGGRQQAAPKSDGLGMLSALFDADRDGSAMDDVFQMVLKQRG